MKQHSLRSAVLGGSLLIAMLALFNQPQALAQGLGQPLNGDYGLRPGSQPPPGFYWSTIYLDYRPDKLRTADGDTIRGAELRLQAYAADFFYVTKKKFLGANYGARVLLPLITESIEIASLDRGTRKGVDLFDIYVEPVNLGWHSKQFDANAIYGFFAPVGKFYKPGDARNVGFGQWAHTFSGGFTVYSDEQRRFHAGALARYEIFSEKRNSDAKVGDILVTEGGLGGTFFGGHVTAGAVYYTQWKMTRDENFFEGTPLSNAQLAKHRYIGVGPEAGVTFGKKYPMVMTGRYYFETGNRVATQGNMLTLAFTFIIPAKQ